jgi:hypothetical protein
MAKSSRKAEKKVNNNSIAESEVKPAKAPVRIEAEIEIEIEADVEVKSEIEIEVKKPIKSVLEVNPPLHELNAIQRKQRLTG